MRVQLEDSTKQGGRQQVDNFTAPFDLDGRWIGEASFVTPTNLSLYYHRVQLRPSDPQTSTALIVTQNWVGLPEQLDTCRTWGLAAHGSTSVQSRQS
ncbi:hypothetical protein [Mycobacterium uberis]|uniref:hypothetical protein n=1 Tax=Mycobacterium uberis TaxID=2162698 RepID=UPI001A9FCBE8|nr:hypothetical protein [Mycobacterium uberis]